MWYNISIIQLLQGGIILNMRWDLSDLYTSFDSKEYKEDFKNLESLVKE